MWLKGQRGKATCPTTAQPDSLERFSKSLSPTPPSSSSTKLRIFYVFSFLPCHCLVLSSFSLPACFSFFIRFPEQEREGSFRGFEMVGWFADGGGFEMLKKRGGGDWIFEEEPEDVGEVSMYTVVCGGSIGWVCGRGRGEGADYSSSSNVFWVLL